MKRTTPTIALLALAGTLSLTACSTDPFSDPCSLLSRSIVADTTGVAMQRADFDDDLSNDSQAVCAWRPVGGGYPIVQVFVSNGGAQVATQRSDIESQLGSSTDITIPGATDAYLAGHGELVGMVIDDRFIQIAVIDTSGADLTDIAIALATKAAERA